MTNIVTLSRTRVIIYPPAPPCQDWRVAVVNPPPGCAPERLFAEEMAAMFHAEALQDEHSWPILMAEEGDK
jgi:hypothetical protein